jgi:hypothetical protein
MSYYLDEPQRISVLAAVCTRDIAILVNAMHALEISSLLLYRVRGGLRIGLIQLFVVRRG